MRSTIIRIFVGMTLEILEIRPRFKKRAPESIPEILEALKGVFEKEKAQVDGSIVHQHVTVKIPADQQHFWSPQLSLNLEETEEGTEIRGLYGPNPNIWLLFMFLYFFLGFVVLALLVIGISRLNLGLTAYILWAIPFVLGGIFVLWFAGKTGKKIGHEQIWQIHNLIKPAILQNAVDVDDW